jgi:hypothetical protein
MPSNTYQCTITHSLKLDVDGSAAKADNTVLEGHCRSNTTYKRSGTHVFVVLAAKRLLVSITAIRSTDDADTRALETDDGVHNCNNVDEASLVESLLGGV